MMNQVFLVGRLTRDAKLVQYKSGAIGASFTLAVDKRVPRDENGQPVENARKASFIPVQVIARKDADPKVITEAIQKLTKGRMVAVAGELDVNNTTDDSGAWHTFVSVIVPWNSWQFLDSPKAEDEASAEASEEVPAEVTA